jgi:hypothetical protein
MPMKVFKADWGACSRQGPGARWWEGFAEMCPSQAARAGWRAPCSCRAIGFGDNLPRCTLAGVCRDHCIHTILRSSQPTPSLALSLASSHAPTPGGWQVDRETTCPPNYPADAPLGQCGHVAFVEVDASMAYRSALAYVATGDERYARQAMAAVQAWATTNKEWGLVFRNGPLEAAWCVDNGGRGREEESGLFT